VLFRAATALLGMNPFLPVATIPLLRALPSVGVLTAGTVGCQNGTICHSGGHAVKDALGIWGHGQAATLSLREDSIPAKNFSALPILFAMWPRMRHAWPATRMQRVLPRI